MIRILAQILKWSLLQGLIPPPLLWALDLSLPLPSLFSGSHFFLSCLDLILLPFCPRLDHTFFFILKRSAYHKIIYSTKIYWAPTITHTKRWCYYYYYFASPGNLSFWINATIPTLAHVWVPTTQHSAALSHLEAPVHDPNQPKLQLETSGRGINKKWHF